MAKSTEQELTDGTEIADDTPAPASALGDIADTLISKMPDVQEHVIEREKVRAAESIELDSAGIPWSANDHAPNKTRKADGTWRKLTQRQAGKKSAVRPISSSRIGKSQDIPQSADVAARASGTVAAGLLVTVGILVGGEEWQPRQDVAIGLNEMATLDKAFGDYFVAKGLTDIPPGWALAICVTGYMLPRFFMPKTRTRLQRARDWVVAKWIKYKAKKAGVRVEVEPAK